MAAASSVGYVGVVHVARVKATGRRFYFAQKQFWRETRYSCDMRGPDVTWHRRLTVARTEAEARGSIDWVDEPAPAGSAA